MKIGVTAKGDTIESEIDPRFGRCKYFLIVEVEGDEIKSVEAVENQGAIQGHGAGIKAAEQISEMGVEKLITGKIGPNASGAIKQLGIEVFEAQGKIGEAITDLIQGKLNKLTETSPQHHGLTK